MPAVSLQISCQVTPPPVCLAALSLSSPIFLSLFPLLLRSARDDEYQQQVEVKYLSCNQTTPSELCTVVKPQFDSCHHGSTLSFCIHSLPLESI